MTAALLQTGSNPVHQLNRYLSSGSPRNGPVPSPRISFTGLRRSSSDSDMLRVDSKARLSSIGSVSFADMSVILEEDMESDFMADWPGNGNGNGNGHGHGNGNGKGNKYDLRRNGNGNGGNEEKSKIGEYYQQMLKSNPGDPLLLRNYGKYLHEVEKNTEKAEECYGRAILASPGDGELLSLYANLIWETQKDEDRAQSYFDRAVHASPDDCMVLGSYAQFLWEADEDEDDEEIKEASVIPQAPAMVGAY